jgi:hypothetical protein
MVTYRSSPGTGTERPLTADSTEPKEITMTDPFADDLFGQPVRGGGAKPEDMEGKLVLFKPTVLGKGPKYQAPGETVDRITADVVIFEEDGTETEISDAYFSQAGLLPPLKNALKPGNKPFVLGRVIKFPSKSSQKKGIETPEQMNEALAEWLRKGGKGEKPQFSWSIAEFSEEDAQRARLYLAKNDQFAASGN